MTTHFQKKAPQKHLKVMNKPHHLPSLTSGLQASTIGQIHDDYGVVFKCRRAKLQRERGGEHLGSKGPRTRLWAHIVGLSCIDGLYTLQSTRQTYFTPHTYIDHEV
jgi:hypothetical protein